MRPMTPERMIGRDKTFEASTTGFHVVSEQKSALVGSIDWRCWEGLREMEAAG
jgi:hypothetical protein